MSKLCLVLAVLTVMTCSKKSPVTPEQEEPQIIREIPQLSLVRVDQSLAKALYADIGFGEVKSTKTLRYLLMNTGTVDVFNIGMTAKELMVLPDRIGRLPAEANVSVIPIVEFMMVHVLPPDGVGELFPLEVGPKEDTLDLSFEFVAKFDSIGAGGDTVWAIGDTVEIHDPYSVEGVKMGGIVTLTLSGVDFSDYSYSRSNAYSENGVPGDPLKEGVRSYHKFTPEDMDTIVVSNLGNVDLPLVLFELRYMMHTVLLETVLASGENIDISAYVPAAGDPAWVLLMGFAVGPVSYMFSSLTSDMVVLDGRDYFCLEIAQE